MGLLGWNQVHVWLNSETLWNNAVAVAPTRYFNLAKLYETPGKFENAIVAYDQVTRSDPGRWGEAHERAGGLLQKRGRIPEVVEHYRKAVRLNPNAIDARESLASGLLNQGEMAEAEQHFRALLTLAPERNEIRAKLGTILAVGGRLHEAAKILTDC
jgi:tetratricopeptide (TPR) repeat protein